MRAQRVAERIEHESESRRSSRAVPGQVAQAAKRINWDARVDDVSTAGVAAGLIRLGAALTSSQEGSGVPNLCYRPFVIALAL